jgi:hypothetical protein
MAVEVRLTNAQAIRLCELIGRVEASAFVIHEALHVDGTDLRTLRNAAVRIMVGLAEQIPGTSDDTTRALFTLLLEQLRAGDHEHRA